MVLTKKRLCKYILYVKLFVKYVESRKFTMSAKKLSALDTQNPEAPTFVTDDLSVVILGGVKLGGLDKLRVTLKVEYKDHPPIRQKQGTV